MNGDRLAEGRLGVFSFADYDMPPACQSISRSEVVLSSLSRKECRGFFNPSFRNPPASKVTMEDFGRELSASRIFGL